MGPKAAKLKCEQTSGYIKLLDDDDRANLAHLEITPIDLPSDVFAAKYYLARSQRENISEGRDAGTLLPADRRLYDDLCAIEGLTKEARTRLALRDRHLVKALKRLGPLQCFVCDYDPAKRGRRRYRPSYHGGAS